jgi:hypothetical protein
MGITRRQFFASAGLVSGAVALARLRPWTAMVRVVDSSDAGRLVALFEHLQSAGAIGEAYLDQRRPPEPASRIAADIMRALPNGRATLRAVGDDELRELLSRRIQADFGEGRVVSVRGWMLSETEANLYALAALH